MVYAAFIQQKMSFLVIHYEPSEYLCLHKYIHLANV